jgi:hypothetical protein
MSQPVCTATTKAGSACRSFALPDRATCLMHTDELRGQVEAARRRGGTVAMKLRVLQGKRQKLDTPRALVKFVSDVMQDTLAGTVEPDVARAALYAVSIQRVLIEASGTEARLAAVERLLAQRRSG